MLLAIALAVTESPQARLDDLISQWCTAHSANASAQCVARQRDGLQKFQSVSVVLHDPQRTLATTCLRKSAVAPSLDWVTAGKCLDDAALEHLERFRNPKYDLRATPLPDIRWVPFSPGVR